MRKLIRPLLLCGATLLAATSGAAALAQQDQTAAPAIPMAPAVRGAWLDPHLSPDVRARAAVASMTRAEKVSILSSSMTMMARKSAPPEVPTSSGYIPAVPRVGLAVVPETDASLGVANLADMRRGDVATALPSSLALGASWDPELAFRGGAMIGSEARAKGFGVMLAGGANLVRDPRGGRAFEYISEDPLLTGKLAGRAIAGVQSNHIVSTMKHLAMNDQETGRNVYDVRASEAVMRESDLLAFQITHEIGRPGSVMCAYNRVNGVYACHNPFLLNEVLRRDWKFDGFVMSDWGGVHSADALLAGLDQQSGYQVDTKHFFGPVLDAAVNAGDVPIAAVDQAATRILRTFFASGVYDTPPRPGGAIDYEHDAKVAQAQAEAGIVLLRNQGGVLPLALNVRRIAVIGGHADVGVLHGGGSSQVAPVGGVKLALKQKGSGIQAFIKRVYGGTAPLDAIKAQFPSAQVDYADGADQAAAAALASRAEVVVLFGEKFAQEATDAQDLALGDGQDELIEVVARANPKTIVVLETGNPVLMPWRDRVAAILQAWYPGQRGGVAIARILAGEVNPSGRLPITFPASVAQLPNPKLPGSDAAAATSGASNFGVLADKAAFTITYPEGSDVGYRWYDRTHTQPLYPFGFGLTYTTFRYAGLKATGGRTIQATFTVTNTGARSGTDVPQVYVTPPGRAKRLVGWARPQLAAGAMRTVTIGADPRLLADYDVATRRWVIRPGLYRVEVGASATAPALRAELRLTGARWADGALPQHHVQ